MHARAGMAWSAIAVSTYRAYAPSTGNKNDQGHSCRRGTTCRRRYRSPGQRPCARLPCTRSLPTPPQALRAAGRAALRCCNGFIEPLPSIE
jgi:hypothetical protein